VRVENDPAITLSSSINKSINCLEIRLCSVESIGTKQHEIDHSRVDSAADRAGARVSRADFSFQGESYLAERERKAAEAKVWSEICEQSGIACEVLRKATSGNARWSGVLERVTTELVARCVECRDLIPPHGYFPAALASS
jgi:hypothetical protein